MKKTLKEFLDNLFSKENMSTSFTKKFETGIQATIEGVMKTFTDYCKLRQISFPKHQFEKTVKKISPDPTKKYGYADHIIEIEISNKENKLIIIELKHTQDNEATPEKIMESNLKTKEKSRVTGKTLETVQEFVDDAIKQVNEYHLDGYDIIERYVVVFIGRYSIVKSGNTTIKKK